MRATQITYVCALLIYAVMILVLISVKALISKKVHRRFHTFNMILFSFIVTLVSHLILLINYNMTDLYCFSNQVIVRFYIWTYFVFIVLFTIYNCTYGLNFDVWVGFKKNMISTELTIVCIISTILIFTLPITLTTYSDTYDITGIAYRYMFIINTAIYFLCFYAFFKNIKNVDPFKAWGPIMFPFLFTVSLIIDLIFNFASFEVIIAYTLIIVYYGIEKREEKLQTELVDLTLSIEKANRFKSDFLSSMSHEIKTPLNSILATSRMIGEKDDINYSVKKELNDIVYSSDLLKETITNILTISKIEIDKLVIADVVFNLNSELSSLPFIEKIKIDSMGISFLIDIDDSVPKLLKGPKDLIRSIVDNALTYTLETAKEGTLTLKVSYKDGELSIIVESLSHIDKDIFAKAKDIDVDIYSTYENEDFGLGIASILVKKLDGKIKSYHENDKNVLTLIVPCEENTSALDFDNIKFTGKRALVVDDVDINLKVANKVLTNLGFECKFDHSGDEAINDINKQSFDIIFLDIMMPNMGGEAVLHQIKNISGFNTPVIALTADEVGGAKEKYISEGFSGYIVKPFTKEDVINEINDLIGGDK